MPLHYYNHLVVFKFEWIVFIFPIVVTCVIVWETDSCPPIITDTLKSVLKQCIASEHVDH